MDVDWTFKPYNWLKEAKIFNKRMEVVPVSWFLENVDILILLFTSKGVDRDGVIAKFYVTYENFKFANLPVEVVYVPMDETAEEMAASYRSQANWFTLQFDDPLVHTLKYMYEVTCMPHLLVLKLDGTVVSSHGTFDLEEYGKNAVLTWLSTCATSNLHRRLSKEGAIYGDSWSYMNVDPTRDAKSEYQRKFQDETVEG
ncbi:unnamed protein product, partial [Iphiclides podalirius]